MTQEYPCRLCRDEFPNEDSSIQWDLCDQWNHIDCIGIRIRKYEKLKSISSSWYCPICLSGFPFFQMNEKELKSFKESWNVHDLIKIQVHQHDLSIIHLRDRRQITFVMLNGFCPLSKNPHSPPVLNGQCRTDGKPTKIGWKKHVCFTLHFQFSRRSL